MNSKVLNTLSIVALAAVIGVMSWRDINPQTDVNASSKAAITAYYAGADITPAMMPDDSLAITIGLGTFSYAHDGKTTWTPQSMTPTTFAQRQVNLQFHFSSLPHDPAETVKMVKAIADDWVHKGDIVNLLIFDYDAEKPDLKAYAAFLKAAHETFNRKYTLFSSIDILWAEGPHKDVLKDMHDDAPRFLISLPQAHISPELLSQLAALKYDFILQFPAGTHPEDIDQGSLGKLDFLAGITLTLDPHKPLPKKEQQIGLFPKL